MANTCPNLNSREWRDLVSVMGDNRINAFHAYQENGNEIPATDSEIVKRIKEESKLNTGDEVEVVKDENGRETDEYKNTKTGKLFQRVGKFLGNFAARVRDKDKTFAERTADNFWGTLDPEEKQVTMSGEAQTKKEYENWMQSNADMATAKGLLIHLAIQRRMQPHRKEEIDQEMLEIETAVLDARGEIPFSWKWIDDTAGKDEKDVIETLFSNLGINYFDKMEMEDDILRDEIQSEVTVSSDLLKIAGTMDMLVRHSDRTYSIIDWKTGNSLNKSFFGMDNLIMKYGNQGTSEIEDSIRNRAKLQIALYALLLRSQNPNIKFRSLDLAWIPNQHNALEKDLDSGVDVAAYIPMIEQFLKDPVMAEAAGLSRDVHSKLLEKDPNIFNPTIYSNNAKSDIVNNVLIDGASPQAIFEDRILRLKLILGGETDFDKLPKSQRKEAMRLLDDINAFLANDGVKVDSTQYEDMSFINLWLGNYSDVTHPMVQSLKQFQDEMKTKAKETSQRKINKFNGLLKPVLQKYYKDKGIKKILGNRAINYDELYGWMYVDESISDETSQVRERLLTLNEENPELQKKYNELTIDQKKLLNYVNETFSEYFNGEKAYMNQTAVLKKNGTSLTKIELYNQTKSGTNKRTWHQGFFFKLPPTDEDIIMRNGNNNYFKGLMSKKTLGSIMFKYATFFREDSFLGWKDETQAIPIKYLGDDRIDNSRSYTRNMEIIFHEGVSEMEKMKEMDAVWSIGQAVKIKLSLEKDHNGEPAYENIIKFLDHKMMMDLQGKMKTIGGRGRSMRIPMYTPTGWKKEKVSVDAVLRGLTKWTSMNTMWLRPWQGIGNGVHAMLLTHRDGMKGSLSGVKLFGISGNAIDFTEGDIVKAEAAYISDYLVPSIKGSFRGSKMFLLAKEFDYFGNNFDYAEMQKTLLSLRNRYMNESMMYLFHQLPEEFVSMTTMAAQLMHMKNEKTGKSIWDSYKVVDSVDEEGKKTGEKEIKWIGGIRGVVKKGTGVMSYTETLTGLNSMEQAKIRKVHERLQGGYRKDEASILEAYAIGKMVIHLKKYLPRLILNAFNAKQLSTELGYYRKIMDEKTGKPIYEDKEGNKIPVYEWQARITEGRMRTLGGMFLNLMSAGKTARDYRWSELKDEQKQNFIEAALTLAIFLTAYGSYLTWFEDLDDDDTTKKWFKMYLVDNLSQQYNLIDLAKTGATAANPVAFAKLSKFAVDGSVMMFATANYAVGNEDLAFTKSGDLRGWNSVKRTLPLVSSYTDWVNRIKNTKDPDSILNYGLTNIRLK